jgi:hypothetical protein
MQDARQRQIGVYRPRAERLEARLLLSIDLGGTSPPTLPTIANSPFGIAFGGGLSPTNTSAGGAGWSVTDAGDVNGDGYDDFILGAPTVTSPSSLGSGVGGTAYLIFGSRSVNSTSITDWIGKNSSGVFNYTPNDRVGDLSQLGATTQTNPVNNATLDFPFSGVKFQTTGGNVASQLGASVASVRLSNGTFGVLIGAPNGTDINGQNIGTGRAYLISGTLSNFIGKTVNFDDPSFTTDFPGLNLVTFVNSTSLAGQLGRSVAGGINILGDGLGDVILGAPMASVGGQTNAGAVYMLSTSFLSGGTQQIDVSTIGQSGTNSVVFAGASSGDRAGFSIADGGDVNGVTSGGVNVNDLLIGAPQSTSQAGEAYLIYGGSNLPTLATTVNSVRFINLTNIGGTGTAAVPGATITGPAGGSLTGFAVSAGGDFNADGFGDILLGSPGFSTSTVAGEGEVSLLYGAAVGSAGYLSGTIPLSSVPSSIGLASFTGAAANNLAGYAVSQVGFINSGQPTLILIGAPGFNSNSGTAYLIPGRAGFTGTFSLGNAEAAPISGLEFFATTPSAPSTSPPFFGASVSSRIQDTSVTADSDSIQDFIIGAPGYDVTQDTTRSLAGGAFIVQGGLITVPIPTSNVITTQIGVGTAFPPASGVFPVNATSPANLQIFVFSTTSTTPPFDPVADIDPTTVTVNGVAFPNATILKDPVDENGDGIEDAIITVTPRSLIGLTSATTSLTISGKTLSTSPLPNQTWTGTAAISVSGGPTPTPTPSPLAAQPVGPVLVTTFNSHFGATQYVPSITQLSTFNYAPIPLTVALQQYLPTQGFRSRINGFNNRGKHFGSYLNHRLHNAGQLVFTSGARNDIRLPSRVFDRGQFHPGKSYSWTHNPPKIGSFRGVVPTQLRSQHLNGTPGVTGRIPGF